MNKVILSSEELNRLINFLDRYESYVISCHINPECDALGSQLALASFLKRKGKGVFLVNQDPVPPEFSFLPGSKAILSADQIDNVHYDAVITVDCSGEDRLGDLYKRYKRGVYINIDHHISNTLFGEINWVEPTASSVCEMIYMLFKAAGLPLKKREAVNIYAGIVNDTGSFRYPNTTAFTHKAAADLLSVGIDGYSIYQKIYEHRDFRQIKVVAETLATINRSLRGKVVWMVYSPLGVENDIAIYDISDEVLNIARQIKEAEVFLLFKPAGKNRVRVNFRSRGKVDVNKVAQMFSGGGHKTASGCSIEGDIQEVVRMVVEAVKQEIKYVFPSLRHSSRK